MEPDNRPIPIDIWSDFACPWCYIGKRRLEAALEEFGEDRVSIEYHSFELSPDTPVDYEGNEVEFLTSRKGISEIDAKTLLGTVTNVARSVGLEYDFSKVRHTNTVLAHQLLHYAKEHGDPMDLSERLFSAYFVEGRHIGRIEDLADLGAEAGLDRDDVVGALEADIYRAAVAADRDDARQLGINAVPFFVIDRRYGIAGAQGAEVFREVLNRATEERMVTS